MDEKPSVICISETWLMTEEESFIKIAGYSMISSFSIQSMENGGTNTFIKKEVKAQKIEEIENMGIEGHIEFMYKNS